MKLTILRLARLSHQDQIDLKKIWSGEKSLLSFIRDDNHRIYAAKFNDRLLGALALEIRGTQGKVHKLEVREVTRRRGVGQYLLEETMRQNNMLTVWWVADDGKADQNIRAAFMQACGFRAQADGWVK